MSSRHFCSHPASVTDKLTCGQSVTHRSGMVGHCTVPSLASLQYEQKSETFNVAFSQACKTRAALLRPLQPWPCLLWDCITLLKTKKTASSAGSFFYQIFFFSLEKVIWKHDSSKQCPTFDYGIVKWKEVFLAGIMMFTQRDSPHQKKNQT